MDIHVYNVMDINTNDAPFSDFFYVSHNNYLLNEHVLMKDYLYINSSVYDTGNGL